VALLMAMSIGGLVGGAVDFAAGVVPGHGAFDGAGADAETAVGHECCQDEAADLPGQVDDGAGDHARGEDDLVAGGVQGDGEAGPVGVGAGDGRGGVGDGGAQCLVGDQQGADFLLDAVGVRARRTRPPRMVDMSSRQAVSLGAWDQEGLMNQLDEIYPQESGDRAA
jgi:hypothetical protein